MQNSAEQVENDLASGPPFSCLRPGRWIPKTSLKKHYREPEGLQVLQGVENIQITHRGRIHGPGLRSYWVLNAKGQKLFSGKELEPLQDRDTDRAFRIVMCDEQDKEVFNIQRNSKDGDVVSVHLAGDNQLLTRIRYMPVDEKDATFTYSLEDEIGSELLRASLPFVKGKDTQPPIITFDASFSKAGTKDGFLKEVEWSEQARKRYAGLSRHFGIMFPKELGECDARMKVGLIALLMFLDIAFSGNEGRPKIHSPWYRKFICFKAAEQLE
ncbi:hypothetical protein Ciccas_004527 [Cichlidogyrus casuarinus]|uniref:Phospholipid scramblase n=1 Tax=Cichlidogyrus casuarinus TaxID=1844966 RepID=A0ABD2QBC9_9PLAT